MIQEYVTNLANQMGIPLSSISVVAGRDVGCFSVHLLHLNANNRRVSILLHQSELDDLQKNACCERFDLKVRDALPRLQ